MNSTQLIDRLNRFYSKLGTSKKYSFLITGNWGIGKTYTYNEFIKSKRNRNHYYSLFGINDLRVLEKKMLKDTIFPTLKNLDEKTTPKVLKNIMTGFLKDLTDFENALEAASPNTILETLTFRDLKFLPKSLVCFDDLERCKIPMEDLMGFIERLKQKTNVVVLCNEKEIKEGLFKIYKPYKEKVIDFTYSLVEVEDKIILGRLSSELDISDDMRQMVLKEFRKYCKDNLRVLEKFIHLYRELWFDLEKKQINQNARIKILKACFYLSCEENLHLIENYIKDKKTSKDWEDSYEEVVRNNLYSNVYEFEYKELIGEIKRYLLGSKDNLDKIIKNLNEEAEEILKLLEEIKLYFLSDTEGIRKLLDDILVFVKKSNEKHYINIIVVLKLYSHYLLFSEITGERVDEEILYKIEQNLYNLVKESHYLRDPYEFCKEDSDLEKHLYFNFNGRLEENIKVKLRKLRKRFDERRKGEILEATENLLKEERYSEVYEEVKYWSHISEFLLEYLENSIKRKVSSQEWDLWAAIISNLKEEERKKVEEVVNKIDRSDKVTELRIEYFCKGNGLIF